MTFSRTLLTKRFIYTFLFVGLHFEAVYLHASARSFVQLPYICTYWSTWRREIDRYAIYTA